MIPARSRSRGPYSLPLNLLRQDITEGKPGLPPRPRIAVAVVNSCAMLENAAVDIWRRDAPGFRQARTGLHRTESLRKTPDRAVHGAQSSSARHAAVELPGYWHNAP